MTSRAEDLGGLEDLMLRRGLVAIAGSAALIVAAGGAMAAPLPAKQAQSFEKCEADFASLQKLFAEIGQKRAAVETRQKQVADLNKQLNAKRISMDTRDEAAQADYKKLLDQYQAQSAELTGKLGPDAEATQARYSDQNAAYEKNCPTADEAAPAAKPKGKS
jgi:septal ring factor EnvC (AmiA/AmiB activator)